MRSSRGRRAAHTFGSAVRRVAHGDAGLDEHIFDIVNQLDRGAALIDLRDERERGRRLK